MSPETPVGNYTRSATRCSAQCTNLIASELGAAGADPDIAAIKSQAELRTRYDEILERVKVENAARPYLEFVTLDVPATIGKAAADALPVVGSVVADAVDKSVEAVKESVAKDGARVLRTALVAIEKDPNLSERFDKADINTRQRLVDDTLRKIGALTSDENLFEGITDKDQRDEILLSSVRLLSKGLAQLRDELRAVQAATAADIKKMKVRIGHANAAINAIRKEQKNVDSTRVAVDTTFAATTEGAEVEKSALRLQQRAAVAEFQTAAKSLTRQLDATAGILSELGAPPQAVSAANFAAGAVSLASGIALCTVDPTAILPTVLGGLKLLKSFGGQGAPDGLGEAIGQVVALQKKILEKLAEIETLIKKNQRELLAGLETINGNVILVYDRVAEQSEQDLAQCMAILPPGAYADPAVPGDGGMILPGASPRFASLSAFGVIARGNVSGNFVQPCKIALGRHYGSRPGGELWSAFRLPGLSLLKPGEGGSSTKVFAAEYFKAYLEDLVSLNQRLLQTYYLPEARWLFVQPALSPAELDQKMSSWKVVVDAARHGLTTEEIGLVEGNFYVPVSPAAVRRYNGFLLGAYVYFELTDKDGNVRAASELAAKGASDGGSQTMTLLTNASLIGRLAVAQRAMDQGDVFLPLAYQLFSSSDWDFACGDNWTGREIVKLNVDCATLSSTEARSAPIPAIQALRQELFGSGPPGGGALLRKNRLFATNLGTYLVARRLRERKKSTFSYAVAYAAQRAPDLLQRVLGDDLALASRSEVDQQEIAGMSASWYTRIAGVPIPLPDPPVDPHNSGFLNVRFSPADQMIGLLELQDLIGREIASGRIIRALGPDQLKAVKELAVAGMSPF